MTKQVAIGGVGLLSFVISMLLVTWAVRKGTAFEYVMSLTFLYIAIQVCSTIHIHIFSTPEESGISTSSRDVTEEMSDSLRRTDDMGSDSSEYY